MYKESEHAFSVSDAGVAPGSEIVELWDIDSDGANDFELVALEPFVGTAGYLYLESEDRSNNPLNRRGVVAAPSYHVNILTRA